MRKRDIVRLAAACLVACAAASAWAQDYTVTATSSAYQSPPASATTTTLAGDDAQTTINLPFAFRFYGVNYTTASICTNGYLQLGAASTAYTNTTFPLPTTGLTGNGVSMHGAICAYWDDLTVGSTYNAGAVKYWTTGSSPNRQFTVCWDQITHYDTTLVGTFSFQVQLFETSNRVVVAYQNTGSTFPLGTSCTIGIQAPGIDNRYTEPAGLSNPATGGRPPADYQFDPKITTFSGRVLYDRLVVDATGVGNAVEQNIPLTDLPVQLRVGTTVVSSTALDGNGDFNMSGAALDSSISNAEIVLFAQLPNVTVRTSAGGAVVTYAIASNVSFAGNVALGNYVIGNGTDPGGAGRAPFHVARTLQQTWAWCAPRTTATIPSLDVLYDAASAQATTYVKAAGPAAAYLRVSSSGTANPDPWDSHVLRKTYARHVLGVLAAHPTTAVDPVFDKATDDQNAFAEAFGYYLNAAISADSKFYDGISATSATVIDLESPQVQTAMGTNVAAWVAAALFDLTDAANEAWDLIDGRSTLLDQTFKTVDSLTTPVTALTFYKAWGDAGFDGEPLSTNFIHHGLVPDDSDEPNDSLARATKLPALGFLRPGRALSLYNSDWYEFTLPDPTNALTAQINYDRGLAVSPLVELRSESDLLIATGVPEGTIGPIVAKSGALPAGKYRVLVKHTGGVALPVYTLQAFAELAFSSAEFQPWTVGHPYNVPVNVRGGTRPYQLTVEQPFVKPPGLVLDGENGIVTGTPSVAGHYGFVLSARDSADPNNIASGSIDFQVNEELEFAFPEFLALPLDKSIDFRTPYTGGTAPFTSHVLEGAIPSGLSVVPGELRLTGRTDVPGGYPFRFQGVDLAASTATGETTAVVCSSFGATPLAIGKSACGFWFDATRDTSVKVSIKTSKKRAKRLLRVLVLGSDGTTAAIATVKGGAGKGSAAFTAPSSGRYYCIAASDAGEATELSASGKLTAPKGGSGTSPGNFVQGKTLTVELGALDGAVFSFTAKPDKSGLALLQQYMIDPSGSYLTFAPEEVKVKGGGFTVTKTLHGSGTWKMVVGAKPGPQGAFTYSYKLKEPKGILYSAD